MIKCLQLSKFSFQDFQYRFTAYLLIELLAYLHYRTSTAVAETMVAFQDYIAFQLMVLQVFLDHLQRPPVSPAETGTAQADLYFLF